MKQGPQSRHIPIYLSLHDFRLGLELFIPWEQRRRNDGNGFWCVKGVMRMKLLCMITISVLITYSYLSGTDFICDLDKLFPLSPGLAALEGPASSSDTLFPALPTRAALSDDLAVIPLTHVAGIGLADT